MKVGWKGRVKVLKLKLGLSVAERLWRESLEIPMMNFEGGTSLEPCRGEKRRRKKKQKRRIGDFAGQSNFI